ncbi:phenylacetaldehyde oxime monooxygenase CYP71AN24-like [Vicia villosa]|uniref:phenylacetaldehyde oxime monooxygenase CYP71AN24-like n=1 Tax=Vicia villosa TaxID=3911 RepID=UPI00273CC90B|nr:phenylacetaldehyde oxime monooxygenase CYP71AN24-like [Vicia villosa]
MFQYLPSFLKHDLNTTLFMFLSFFISILLVLKFTKINKLNQPPSPPGLPIIGNYLQLGTLPHRSFHSLSQTYGPLMLLHLGQLRVLVVSSVDMAKEVMYTHDTIFASRPNLISTKALLYGCKDVAFATYGDTWRQKKKLCVIELLSQKRVQSVEFIREEEAMALVDKIRKALSLSEGCCTVNLSEMLIATANNIICRCMFGKKYDDDDGCRFGELARQIMIQVSDFSMGDLFPSLSWVDVLTGQIKKFKTTFKEMDDFFDQIIVGRRMARRDPNKKDFLDILLQLQADGLSEFDLTENDLKAVLMDMFLGGSDTSSTTVEWAMAELVKNPVIMKKAREEVRRIVGNKSKIEDSDVDQMDYMKCVIKETLRLHPAAPLLAPRETTSSVKLGGYDIPEKTLVYINAWAIQMDPAFWEMPEEFLPERFENNKVNFNGQDFQFIPFGSGRRKCPGIGFGLASAEHTVANLLYWFDWKLPTTDDASLQEIDMTEKFGLTVNKKVPLYLQPIPNNNFKE